MPGSPSGPPIEVFVRPGCPYCVRLRRSLKRYGLVAQEIDIWRDQEAAATVRAITGGDETVPTVRIGQRTFVNPRAADILVAVRQLAPELLPAQMPVTGLRRLLRRIPRHRRA